MTTWMDGSTMLTQPELVGARVRMLGEFDAVELSDMKPGFLVEFAARRLQEAHDFHRLHQSRKHTTTVVYMWRTIQPTFMTVSPSIIDNAHAQMQRVQKRVQEDRWLAVASRNKCFPSAENSAPPTIPPKPPLLYC